ncbi:MAG: type II toxin-antitoxin system RelE/ParE family toxin [Chryseobacterium sp.]|nr:MAG: type II toxin-antitoxin system RelE/ParE family toxin [Chryseobacterium sp.]
MAKQLIWTSKARAELREILEYWAARNKSKTFSRRLYGLINEQLALLCEFPHLGRATDIPGVYIKVVHKYLVYYEIKKQNLYVLTIRHGSRDSETPDIE